MNEAAAALVGEHDFSSFCRRPDVQPGQPDAESRSPASPIAEWSLVDTHFGAITRFEIAATSFCHQMVRSIVGTLVDVGRGRRIGDVVPARRSRRSTVSTAGPVAPPHGLVLWDVDYRGTRWNV